MIARHYWSWMNGEYVRTEEAVVSHSAGAIAHGYGVFETLYYHDGMLYELPAHRARLLNSAAHYRLIPPPLLTQDSAVATVVAELAQRNAITEGRVRLSLSARDLHYQEPLIQSSLSITIDPYVRPVTPVHLVTAAAAAFGCPLAQHKSTSYASYILARQYALSQGATDTLMRNAQGDIIEGATCNVFFARGGQWATPDLQTYGLPGIQRGVVLARLGESHGGCDVQCDQDWQTWEHAVVTNSLIGTLPVASINGEPLPLPGEEFVAHLCAPQTRYPC